MAAMLHVMIMVYVKRVKAAVVQIAQGSRMVVQLGLIVIIMRLLEKGNALQIVL